MKSLLKLLGMDLRRSFRPLLLAGVGIFLTAALLSFLLGFERAIEELVIPSYIPLDRLELTKSQRHLDLGPLRVGIGRDSISEEDLEKLSAVPGVRALYPGLSLGVSAVATGGAGLLGHSFSTEVAAQGIDPDLVSADIAEGYVFGAREVTEGRTCLSDQDCTGGDFCSGPLWGGGHCRQPIPVLISPRLVRLFNSGIRKVYQLPQINPDSLIGLVAEIDFGASTLGGSGNSKIFRDHMRLVGYSERATPIGVSMPLEEIRTVNRRFGAGMQNGADTVVLLFDSISAMADAGPRFRGLGFEAVDSGGKGVISALHAGRTLLLFLAGVVVFIAVLGLFQGIVGLLERRREELSVLRAIGASVRDVFLLMTTEIMVMSVLAVGAGLIGGGLIARLLEKLGDKAFAIVGVESFYLFEWKAFGILGLALVILSGMAAVVATWSFLRTEKSLRAGA